LAKNFAPPILKGDWGTPETSLTWSDLQKNRQVKQKLKSNSSSIIISTSGRRCSQHSFNQAFSKYQYSSITEQVKVLTNTTRIATLPKNTIPAPNHYFGCKRKKLYFAFVDLEKAFDRVPREVTRWAIRKAGVDEWLVKAVMAMYEGAQTVVRTIERDS